MHEIISLQFGQRSNYLATHFWNVQVQIDESYFTYNQEEQSPVDHDVHFRPGIGIDGIETFTPRTLIYDLKGGFGALRKYNALYESQQQASLPKGLWHGNEVVQQQPIITQNEYQRCLDEGVPPPQLSAETVRYWSDFNRVYYHPRSIVQLNDYELNSNLMPFENWHIGEELFENLDKEQDLLDRDIRPFAEECDQLRALQIFTASDDAWGGFASKYVERLTDEYRRVGVWVWALEGREKMLKKQLNQTTSSARTLCAISPQSTIYCPILDPPYSLPSYLSIDLQSEWYTSALVSSAVETITMPTRLRHNGDFETSLIGEGGGLRRIFELQSAIIPERDDQINQPSNPAGKTPSATENESNKVKVDMTTDFDIDFTVHNNPSKEQQVFNQVRVIRGLGVDESSEESLKDDPRLARKLGLHKGIPNAEIFQTHLRFPIIDSYPRNLFPRRNCDTGLRICAALTSSSRMGYMIKNMQTTVARTVAVAEREALVNGLGEIRELYEEGWMSDSDSVDD
ncbi:Tubulin domain containing protein [Elaphomyces granulatus]